MKKLNFLKMTLLAIIMMVGSVGVMGQTTATITIDLTSAGGTANLNSSNTSDALIF